MTKFEEMRLRAIKFQEMTGCGLILSKHGVDFWFSEPFNQIEYSEFLDAGCPEDYVPKLYDFSYSEMDDTMSMLGEENDFESVIGFFCNKIKMNEDEWTEMLVVFSTEFTDARFPTLLEALGWINVENALPEHAQNIAFYSQGSWAESRTYYGYYDERLGGFVSHTDAHVGSPLYWKPLEIFPEPFQDTNV